MKHRLILLFCLALIFSTTQSFAQLSKKEKKEWKKKAKEYSKNPEGRLFVHLAEAYRRSGELEKARAILNQGLERHSDYLSARIVLAQVETELGATSRAAQVWREVIELDPDNEPAKAALQKLQAALVKQSPTPTNTATVQKKEPVPQNTTPTNTTPTNTTPTQSATSTEPTNFGALNRFAARMAIPVYPSIERQRATEGLVTVEVSLDEEGKVVSAKAISGPRGLRQAAEDAVRKSKFNPVLVGEKPVKANGFINFNFKLR